MNLEELKNVPSWDWPTEVGTLLCDSLRNKELGESDRKLAIELSGELGALSDEHAGALLELVQAGDESTELRAHAAVALGPSLEMADLGECDADGEDMISEGQFALIKKTLKEVFEEQTVPAEVRRRVLEVAVRSPEDWQKAAIGMAYDQKNEDWRLTAVFCMQFHQGFDKQILESLSSEVEMVRYHAVCAAGNFEIAEAWFQINDLVSADSTEKQLRIAAIEAAANIRPSAAADILGKLMDSEDPEIAEAAEEALSTTGAMAGFGAEFEEDEEDEDDDEDDDGPVMN